MAVIINGSSTFDLFEWQHLRVCIGVIYCNVITAQTVEHAIRRKQFDRPLTDFGLIQVKQFSFLMLWSWMEFDLVLAVKPLSYVHWTKLIALNSQKCLLTLHSCPSDIAHCRKWYVTYMYFIPAKQYITKLPGTLWNCSICLQFHSMPGNKV